MVTDNKDWRDEKRREKEFKDGTLPVGNLTVAQLDELLTKRINGALNNEFDELWDKEKKFLDPLIKKKSPAKKFFEWCKKRWVTAISLILLPATFLVGEGIKFISANSFDKYGVEDIVFNSFGLKKSSHPIYGPCIYGSNGESAYRDVNNKLADAFEKAGYSGYGYCRPVKGGVESIELVNKPDLPWHVGITQSDVYAILRARGEIDYSVPILELNNISECALMPANQNFKDFEGLATAIEYAAQNKESPVKIGLKQKGSGSYATAHHIMEKSLNPDGYEIFYYNSGEEVSQAVANGKIDAGIVVEYPGMVKHEFRSAMKPVVENDIHLLGMSKEIYMSHFNDKSIGYNLTEVEIKRGWSYNGLSWPIVSANTSKSLPPMLCTSGIKIVGYNPELIENDLLRREIEDRNQFLKDRINTQNIGSDKTVTFKVISSPM